MSRSCRRSDYAPPGDTAQIFVTMSAVKIGAQSLGTAAAGLLGTGGDRLGMVAGAFLILAVVGVLAVDRSRHPAVPVPA